MTNKLLSRNFLLLWQGQSVSSLGNQAFLVAVPFWLMETTGSASLMGVMMMLISLPALVVAPIGGALADRFSRRLLVVLTDLAQGVAILCLAGLLVWRPEVSPVTLGAILIVALISGTAGALFYPAIQAALPDLVPVSSLTRANSILEFSRQLAVTLGRALGGWLFKLLGAPVLLLFNGVAFLVSAATEAFLRIPRPVAPEEVGAGRALNRYWTQTKEGFEFIFERRGMRDFLLSVTALNFFFTPLFVLLPFYVAQFHGRRPEMYGFLLAAFSGGILTSSVISGSFRFQGMVRSLILRGALLITAVLFGIAGFLRHPYAAISCFALIGLLVGVVNIHVVSLFQMSSPSHIRGRVMGLVVAFSRLASPLGMALGGMAGDLVDQNIPLIYGGCGLATFLIAALAASRRPLREFLAWEPPRDVEEPRGQAVG